MWLYIFRRNISEKLRITNYELRFFCKILKEHIIYVPFFYFIYDDFIYDNNMMQGLSPENYNDNLLNLSIISFL